MTDTPGTLEERLRVPLPEGMCGQSMGCNAASICLCSHIEDQRELLTEAADEIASLRRIIVDIRAHYGDCVQGPGHSHQEWGIWDGDNHPGLAGTQCEWCALWDKARQAVRAPLKDTPDE